MTFVSGTISFAIEFKAFLRGRTHFSNFLTIRFSKNEYHWWCRYGVTAKVMDRYFWSKDKVIGIFTMKTYLVHAIVVGGVRELPF